MERHADEDLSRFTNCNGVPVKKKMFWFFSS